MNQTVQPGSRTGTVSIPASKSQAHRLLICAALGQTPVTIRCLGISKDIAATIGCLNALGAEISVSGDLITAKPIEAVPEGLCHLPCGESGSTLRFLLPVAGALGASVVFHMEGRLPQRPLHPLDAVLTAHGMTIRQENDLLYSSGQLCPGEFSLPGNVSSQYISGLLMALPLLDSGSALTVTGELESAAYVTMTEDALRRGGVSLRKAETSWRISGGQRCQFPAQLSAEGDWSNAAFFLCMGALSPEGVTVHGLDLTSSQGDRAVLNILAAMGARISVENDAVTVRRGELNSVAIDAGPIPDLIPVLSVAAAGAVGDTHIFNAGRLRLKESDRLHTTAQLLTALGGSVEEQPSGLIVHGAGRLTGGTADACGDHRIAMSAAVAACICESAVSVSGSECVSKSYPRFWEDLDALKGGAL
ncbi:MAG: 3-phosphoshikimate 1-carboxyvinyltransferase [Dysosmobacter sp.]|nr:3-phosphoshikimate 1-carboxyvinyltransferase [Dysosmobacter sp.]MDY3866983.1 3-phosphoshikimate 1-carboxyvinyltransferase [Dysosmobacter sp.]